MSPLLRRIVIVGGGVAGLRTAEALRRNGFSGELVGINAENRLPYARPSLSKDALFRSDWECVPLETTAGVRWQIGVAASGLDLEQRRVELDDGSTVAFDAAVVATGVRARVLRGTEAGLTLRTADDAEVLHGILHGDRGHLVIVGAGFIGSEVAVTAHSLGWAVTIVDSDATPLARALGPSPARWLWEQHRVRGVRTRFGQPVQSIQRSGGSYHVTFAHGSVIQADAVVASLGAVPNTEWLRGSGVDITDGVLTDSGGRAITVTGTVVDGVVAVGDVARTPSRTPDGRAVRHEHWAVATTSAQRAAATLTGRQPPVELPPVFWTDVYEHRVQVVGHPSGVESEPEPGPRGFCLRYESGDGTLTGAVVVNWPQLLPVLSRRVAQAALTA